MIRHTERRRAALFLLILFLLLYLPGRFLTPKVMNSLDLSSGRNGVVPKILSEPRDSIDLLVIGDSESYTSIDPRIIYRKYGVSTYAAGQAGATMADTEEILKKTFTRQMPSVVLYETNSLYRKGPAQGDVGAKISNTFYRFFPLLKYHSAWKSPFIAKFLKTYKGFRIDRRVRAYRGGSYMDKNRFAYDEPIDRNNLKSLLAMKKFCENKGARFIMYSAPSPKNYDYGKHMELTRLAAKEHIEYIDLNMHNKEMHIDWKRDTRDRGDHLNLYGARKTTLFMGRYLDKNQAFEEMMKESISAEKR